MKLNFKNDGGRVILFLEIIGREDSEGWLESIVGFDNDGFAVRFQISLMLNDLYPFLSQLELLNDSLKGRAVLSTIEHNVNLIFSTDGLGHISINGTLRHPNNYDLKMSFVIQTDQTLLPSLISECNQILEHYRPQ